MEWTCQPVGKDGVAQYLHLVWGEGDPERKPRPKGGQKDRTPHHTFNKMSDEDLQTAIVEHLRDDIPRTFNRICVELWDKNASILFKTKADQALWDLVEEGILEHTFEVPVLFRLREE